MNAVQLCIIFSHSLCVFSVLVLLPHGASGQSPFTRTPPSVLYVESGKTARFVWDYVYSGDRDADFTSYSPTWYYKDSQQTQIAYEYKYSTPKWKWIIAPNCPISLRQRVSKESTATLVVSNVTIADGGLYQCSIGVGFSTIITEAQLIVTVQSQFTPQPPIIKNIEEGQDLSLPCTAIGRPTPNITWVKKEGHVIKSTGTGSATLSITNIKRDKNGILYECQARNNPNENPVTGQTMINVYYSPQATLSSPSMTVKQGDEIVLRCTATGNPQPSISWTKSGGAIKAGHTAAAGTLRIPGAIKTDAGKYMCTAKNTYGGKDHSHTATVTVVVQYQPSIPLDILLKQKSTFNISDSLTLNCEADGNPTPTFKWKTPSGSVHTGSVFNMATVSRSDAGTYKCIASNGIGTEVNASVQVTVQYKPVIDETISSRTSESWNGNIIRLKCFAAGRPTPRMSWYKPTTHQMATGVNIVPGGSEVTVRTTADPGDYGQYKCRASNILGSDEHFITVTRMFSPGLVAITIYDIEASSVIVMWTKPANDGGRPVTGYKIEINSSNASINKLNESLAVITKLDTNTRYLVNVYATSDVGDGNASTKVFTTLEQGKPGVPDLRLTLDNSKGLSVTLTWTIPVDNGADISKYTIYMKEDNVSKWTMVAEALDTSVHKYTVTKNIKYGMKYKFLVTAWNEYGESVNLDALAKPITMPCDPPTNPGKGNAKNKCVCEKETKYFPAVGVLAAILVVSLGFNGLLMLYMWKKNRQHAGHVNKAEDDQTYDNVLKTRSNSSLDMRPATEPVPEYEAVQPRHNQRNHTKVLANSSPCETHSMSNEPSQYQELTPTSPAQDTTRPLYEPLRTSVLRPDNEPSNYQPLGPKNESLDYQTLRLDRENSMV